MAATTDSREAVERVSGFPQRRGYQVSQFGARYVDEEDRDLNRDRVHSPFPLTSSSLFSSLLCLAHSIASRASDVRLPLISVPPCLRESPMKRVSRTTFAQRSCNNNSTSTSLPEPLRGRGRNRSLAEARGLQQRCAARVRGIDFPQRRRGAEATLSTPSLPAAAEGSQEERISLLFSSLLFSSLLFSSLLFSSLLSALLI
jgi:hypothetical protein